MLHTVQEGTLLVASLTVLGFRVMGDGWVMDGNGKLPMFSLVHDGQQITVRASV